ncbi:potassium channel family protein [Methylobacterium sp. J-072]|uniref:potassium channel family protein n=1 Tax=Methylobacterium sp. J-072 TaxID=2836651 RepID=UPI001FB9BDE4|nr:potassium channel family protein [Methylobacterium sp. J-072]MCJ2090992.1 potassium channel family protein [Methylobacterium sp. J-072]
MATDPAAIRASMINNGSFIILMEVVFGGVLPFLPFNYVSIPLTIFSTIATFFIFSLFMLSFNEIEAAGSRPTWLVAVFLVVNLVLVITLFAHLYDWSGIVGDNCTNGDFFDACYFSIITLTTVGYGDCHAIGRVGKTISAIEALCGFLVLGLLLSAIQNIFRPTSR